ncbi:hypothetical protein BD410DRAFT_704255, partial [Rickenella mellea]
RRVRALNPSFVLENSGSVARDHLALERTFLAYVRTSLGCASMGVALVQLLSVPSADGTAQNATLTKFVTPLGATTIVVGLSLMIIGFVRYFRVQRTLMDGKFLPAGNIVHFTALALSCLVFVVFAVVL